MLNLFADIFPNLVILFELIEEIDIVIRSCGVAKIDETCEHKVIDGKNNNQEMRFCYSTCYIDACNSSLRLKGTLWIFIILILFLNK